MADSSDSGHCGCGTQILRSRNGWMPKRCAECKAQNNRDRVVEWQRANPDRARARTLGYAMAHRAEAQDRAKAWYHANKERAQMQPSRQPAAKKAYNAAYYAANRDSEMQRMLAYARGSGRGRKRAADAYRRAVKKGSPDSPAELFTLDEVFERDGRLCQLCGLSVDRADATMDHIIPITKGGPHTRANVQLAHRSCNTRKGNRM